MMDDITAAVLSREEVAEYLQGSHGLTGNAARERIIQYLDELRTTQRYELYRALEYPLFPILRKIERIAEHADRAVEATRAGRVVYASNHRSHTDYLIEPLVLDDAGVRPPVIAAGINLFGGPLGFIHKHVTGALPIRRNTKDPAYLITLKAYVAELLRKHDLFFYPEGGRSYSGELKSPKTGLFNACLSAGVPGMTILPTAIAYDLVLEDHILARQRVKRRQRPFSRELAEMVRYAVGYRSRAYVTFGRPIPLEGYDFHSRRSVLDLSHLVRGEIGRLVKVLPTAVVAAAIRPSIAPKELAARADAIIAALRAVNANLGVHSGEAAVESAAPLLADRGIIVLEAGRFRVRERHVLRYYARSLEHLLQSAGPAH
ncbi:MAG: 1-acyl-sn-glycerol-3-phosphate acyltransferase [Vicinamibacterales bacterium]